MLFEGINDRGIFKVLFLAGLPGSGKSTVARKLLASCPIRPKIVDFDHLFEYLSMKHDVNIGPDSKPLEVKPILDKAANLTRERLTNYVNGMLPLLIDGTAENPTHMINRTEILRAMGYDIGILWVKTDVNTSIERAATRDRHVDPEFIRAAAEKEDKNIRFLEARISPTAGGKFILLNTAEGTTSFETAAKEVDTFFTAPVQNQIGVKYIEKLKMLGGKTLSPTLYRNIDTVGTSLHKWNLSRR